MQRISLQRIQEENSGPDTELLLKRQHLKEDIQKKKYNMFLEKKRMGETFRDE